MASNDATLLDGDGNSSDWIELYNPTDQAINLSGWHLTDDSTNLNKWTFPASPQSLLQPGDFLVVFASGQDSETYVDPAGYLHTDFKLSSMGEYLGLTDADENIVFDFGDAYPQQVTDVSYGPSFETLTLVGPTNTTSAFVPTDGSLDAGLVWTTVNFDDNAWPSSVAGVGVGYEKIVPGGGGTVTVPPNGLTLNGPLGNDLTDTGQDGTLDVTIDAGGANGSPALEQPHHALDGTASTKWLAFRPSGTHYEVQFTGGAAHAVNGYTLTSANDAPDRDPYSWTLSGSNDGVVFTAIDSRSAQDFPNRFQTKYYEFTNTTAYSHYRFAFQTEYGVTGANEPVAMQVAEIELFDSVDLGGAGGTITGLVGNDLTDKDDDGLLDVSFDAGNAGTSPNNEEPDKALDNSTSTKWLAFSPSGTYFKVDFLDGLPRIVDRYTLTSANDAPERDPYSWTLSGSHDGTNYTVVDTQNAEDFAGRFETHLYEFANVTAYAHYRFDFQTEFGVTGTNQPVAIQLAEIELLSSSEFSYVPLIDLDVASEWDANQSSVYQRVAFNVADPTTLTGLRLDLQYEDGFVAYLNGVEVASSNRPAALDWQSLATATREPTNAITPATVNLSQFTSLLNPGANVLAIHLLNAEDTSNAILSVPKLSATVADFTSDEPLYYEYPSPRTANEGGRLGFVDEPAFSFERGFYDSPFSLSITTGTSGADIYYTTNGDDPTPTNGTLYTAPLTISGTTVVRAGAYKADHYDSNLPTHTYLFLNDIVRQDYQATLNAGFPTSWGAYNVDYGLDPDVIGTFDASGNPLYGDNYNGRFANTIKSDLQVIPTLSLSLPIEEMFGADGIYSNPTSEGTSWERGTSVELIYPDGTTGFQVDAAIRIQGGAFRRDDLSKKHSFRLLFKGEYGPTKLEFPFFGSDAASRFDTITLRMESNDGYAWDAAGSNALYSRNSFANRSAAALGQVSPHDNRVHLYLNGIYWGLYNPNERPDASFSAEYHGGKKSEWDAFNDGKTIDGTADSWNTFVSLAKEVANAPNETARRIAYQKIQGNNLDGTNNPDYETYLDVDNYIDYLLVNFYVGNQDWPQRNWYASRRRGSESTGYKFHIWDAETSLGLNSNASTNRIGVAIEVAEPYALLRSSEDFRLRFADRAHRALFHNGALTPAKSISRYQEILNEVDSALNAESARWGDMHRATPYTSLEWISKTNDVINNFLTPRTNIFISQLTSAGLYSSVTAPAYNQQGGNVPFGFLVSMTASSGVIYYTTDGSDPRAVDGTVAGTLYQTGLAITGDTVVRSRTYLNGQWSALNETTFELATSTGDFDANGRFDCADVDALVANIVAGSHATAFDLTGDGQVSTLDLDKWRNVAGASELASGNPFPRGDVNLDGSVDATDFGIWNANRFTSNASWCAGDLNADGSIDVSDFNLWNTHNGTNASAVAQSLVAADVVALPAVAADVDRSGTVAPLDALLIINELKNREYSSPDGSLAENLLFESKLFFDVNGDHLVTPLDALLVINRLNEIPFTPSRSDSTLKAPLASTDDLLTPDWPALSDEFWKDHEESLDRRRSFSRRLPV